MNINAYPFPSAYFEKRNHNKTVIVVDLLRATTSILEALINGANQVIPTKDVSEARMLAANWGKEGSVLAGESGGLKLAEYDLGNSPLEFTRKMVADKNVLINTTNGTNAILESKNAYRILIGCLRNCDAVAKAALAVGRDILVICAGTEGEASAEDMICAGGILQVIHRESQTRLEYNDFSLVCSMMYSAWKEGKADLHAIRHYRRLLDLGFQEDLDYCFTENQTDAVPVYEHGSIRLS